MITFITIWAPNNVPTPVASATIDIYDATTQSDIISGALMNPAGTGIYEYNHNGTDGHTYVGTMNLVALNGVTSTAEQVVTVPSSTTIPASNDDGSSDYMTKQYAMQRGLWTNVKVACLGAIATALDAGDGPSYSISGRVSSESLSMNEFISNMRESAARATEMEVMLTKELQNVQPFNIRQRLGIGARWGQSAFILIASIACASSVGFGVLWLFHVWR